MSYVVADGKSNWLEGVILICSVIFQTYFTLQAHVAAQVFT